MVSFDGAELSHRVDETSQTAALLPYHVEPRQRLHFVPALECFLSTLID